MKNNCQRPEKLYYVIYIVIEELREVYCLSEADQYIAGHVLLALASIKRGFRIRRIIRQFDTLLI